jgi:hypothetical protein
MLNAFNAALVVFGAGALLGFDYSATIFGASVTMISIMTFQRAELLRRIEHQNRVIALEVANRHTAARTNSPVDGGLANDGAARILYVPVPPEITLDHVTAIRVDCRPKYPGDRENVVVLDERRGTKK